MKYWCQLFGAGEARVPCRQHNGPLGLALLILCLKTALHSQLHCGDGFSDLVYQECPACSKADHWV